jgi:hypothetical protein
LNIYRAKLNAADLVLQDIKHEFADVDCIISVAVATHSSQRIAFKAEFKEALAQLINKITKSSALVVQ